MHIIPMLQYASAYITVTVTHFNVPRNMQMVPYTSSFKQQQKYFILVYHFFLHPDFPFSENKLGDKER